MTGRTKPGRATLTFERGDATVVVKEIPGEVCDACGEANLTPETVRRLERIVDEAVASGVQVDVRRYLAA